jgi:hypothetical protein
MINYAKEFPKPFSITKWLCVSSCFLLVPGAYAFFHGLYLQSFLCVLAAVLSLNHWRCAENGYRRFFDKSVAWICFFVFLIYGCLDCQRTHFYYYTILLFIVASSFFLSNYLSVRWHPYWFGTHMFFHFVCALATCVVIYCVSRKRK